jgi:hypothetical protein
MAEELSQVHMEDSEGMFFLKSFACTVLSHSLTGFILSPIDLIKTRLGHLYDVLPAHLTRYHVG